ncbi:hypothetical protein LUZ61_018795 [Rhynchospora tenuis]|uniref:DET1- and DDB1-associated protein 1 domain-containing protein n=1 Tax=Rhynchospora tenuis TaxID=198213 RepID=A0AAD5ZA25_9POAL|nr:hypothetical protein LUZ61_018795 [Rhynchospora tenuis]
MGSLLGDWPSFDPHNFSQLRPADPTAQPSKLTPVTYHPTHNRTLPPPNQVITTESKNILLRQFYQKSEEQWYPKKAWHMEKYQYLLMWVIYLSAPTEGLKYEVMVTIFFFSQLRPKTKRAASENLMPEHSCKQPRGLNSDV